MKRNNLTKLSLISMLTISVTGILFNPTINQIAHAATKSQIVAQATPQSGAFVGVGHQTQGNVSIVTENGKRYLEFDQGFKTDNGPDLFVLLHREDIPKSYGESDYVSLGRLQTVKGTQRYEIPDDLTLESFRSAVIWCRRFNVTFGYATLSNDE